MSHTLLSMLYGWAAFNLLVLLFFAVRAFGPNCRNCICWQRCLHEQLQFAASRGTVTPKIYCIRPEVHG
jgi:hypothetical protein